MAVKPVVTIGTFDGVHLGHQEVIKKLLKISSKISGESVIFTFYPHPRLVVNSSKDPIRLLTTQEEKIAILQKSGIDHLIIYPFTKEFSKLSYHDFVKDVLVSKMHIHYLVIGYDHKFGQNRQGDFNSLKLLSHEFGFKIDRLDELALENNVVSSTKIRKAIDEGDIRKANQFLGYKYILMGRVVEGMQLGRQLGFPTANIEPYDSHKLIPRDGVYAVNASLGNRNFKGMLNIGFRPTINTNVKSRSIEVHIFDFDEDIYNSEITLSFEQRIRDEEKFSGLEELRIQMIKDREYALRILSD